MKKIALGVVAAILVLWIAVYIFRDALASRALALVVDNVSALQCNHPRVHISPSLRQIFLSPLDCEIAGKPMRRLQTHDDVTVTLGATSIDDVHVKRATVDYKERDLSQVQSNTLGDIAALTGVSDKLVKSLLDASENYSESSPPLRVDVLTMQRAGKTSAVMHNFSKGPDGAWERTYAERVESGSLELRKLDMRATPSRGRLTTNIFLGAAERGEKADVRLLLEAEQLDTKQPRVTLHLR